MAVIVGYRDTSRARIFSVLVAGREVRIKKLDHDPDEDPTVTQAFLDERLAAVASARQVWQAENDAEETALGVAGFRQWLAANLVDRRVRKLIRPLVRIYLDEVS